MAGYKPRVISLTKRPGHSFGFYLRMEHDEEGHLIRCLEMGGPAELAGMKDGDRILRVNGTFVDGLSHSEVVEMVKNGGASVAFHILDESSYVKAKAQGVDLLNPGSTPVANGVAKEALKPKLCYMVKSSSGYGFSIRSVKDEEGLFMTAVIQGGVADRAGVNVNDRLLEVNGENVEGSTHDQVVDKIRLGGSSIMFLLVDEETDRHYQSKRMKIGAWLATAKYLPHKPRVIDMTKGPDGYGFLLKEETNQTGHFIKDIDRGSPGERAGLKERDKLIAVDGCEVDGCSHEQVVDKIRQSGNKCCLLVVDKDTDQMYTQGKVSPMLFLEEMRDSMLEHRPLQEILAEADFYSSPQPQRSAGAVSVNTVNSQLARVQKAYRLEGSVKVWSDFLRIHLHPRTISVIHQYNHDGESQRLEAFGQGEALLQGSVLEQLEDKLHFFVEECDYLQGFQVFCDLADGFAGLGSKVTEMLQDSYGGRGILTWGIAPVGHPDSTPMKELYHMLNCTIGTVHMASHSSFFCPLTLRGGLGRRPSAPPAFPHLNYDPSMWYHSSAVLALALDALTLPYRLKNNSVPMWQVADSLAVSGRKVVAAYGAVPFPMMHGSSLPDALSACTDALPWKPLSACSEPSDGQCYGQWAMLRGFECQRLISSHARGTKPPTPLHSLHSGEDVLDSYIRSFYPTAPLALQLVSEPSKLTPPFPQIFSQSVCAQGFLQSQRLPPGVPAPVVSSAPVMTSLQSGPALGPWLSELHRGATTSDIRRAVPSFLSQGPEMANYEEALEELRLMARCYRDDSGGVMRSSSEEDDDD